MPKEAQYRDPFVQQIVQHWEANFPKEAALLERAGKLVHYAERAADRAGRVNEQALTKGLNWSQAEELSAQEWGSPPTLS